MWQLCSVLSRFSVHLWLNLSMIKFCFILTKGKLILQVISFISRSRLAFFALPQLWAGKHLPEDKSKRSLCTYRYIIVSLCCLLFALFLLFLIHLIYFFQAWHLSGLHFLLEKNNFWCMSYINISEGSFWVGCKS